uniref:CUB domain-containing protein n=1 Tax=Pogona vitticeps TaxID=103695 RepID=A0ABM5F2Y7_9SAUR
MGKTLALPRRAPGLPLLTATTLVAASAALGFWGAEAKVYYSCGAQFKSMERGLILSPGFPNNYSSGIHCIWEFFIPARTYLMLEIFDFDVFESMSANPDAWDGFLSLPENTNKEFLPSEENIDFPTLFPTVSSALQESNSTGFYNLRDGLPEAASQKLEAKPFQQIKEPKELGSAKPSKFLAPTNDTLPRETGGGVQEEHKNPKDKTLFSHLADKGEKDNSEGYNQHPGEDVAISTTVSPMDSSSTSGPSAEICPHDVLYVSDLFAFSSRFCGTKSPLNKNMSFGSSLKMVEVIVELITTTDRGRGFAMLFEYKNDTEPVDVSDSKEGKENIMMLVIITGILFFALVLLSSLCIACRQKLCPKRSTLDVHCDQENGIQNAAADLNELHVVIPSQENENNNHSVGGNGAVTSGAGSMECSPPQTDPDGPSSLSAVTTESGSDEVFIISASPGAGGLSFTSYRIQDKNLRRSITSPGSVRDWLGADQAEPDLSPMERGLVPTESCGAAQRTWSAHAFHDLLAPLPQLQKKWCSWSTTSPFTKLVNNGGFSTSVRNQSAINRKVTSAAEIDGISEQTYSDSSGSAASYPLTHSAQKERKLSSGCNLKKSRFGNPYLGFLMSSPDCHRQMLPAHPRQAGGRSPLKSPSQRIKNIPEGPFPFKSNAVNGSTSKELALEIDHPKPAFVISEEGDDQQPLVLSEHMNQCTDALSEPEGVIRNLGMTVADEQPVAIPLHKGGLFDSSGIRTDLDLWRECPSSYKDALKNSSTSEDQSYVPVPDAGAVTAHGHQNFDSLATHRLCPTSVQ